MIHKNRWIVDLSMLTSVGMRQLREDPALLLLQATRRLPLRIRSKYIPQHYQGRLGAWCAHLSGHPEKAKLLLSKSGKSAGVLASQLGIEPDPKDRKNQARVAAATGELTQACSLVPETPIAARAASELRILSPRFKLRDLPHSQLPQSATTTRVAMLLTNSLPHTQSGYTQRAQLYYENLNSKESM